MKTQWEFRIETRGLVLGQDRDFIGTAQPKNSKPVSIEVKVIRDSDAKSPAADDAGKVLMRIPGTPEDTEAIAYSAVHQLTERMAFPHGDIQVLGGLVVATKLPETDQEAEEIGDKRHVVRLSFEEFRGHPPVDGARLSGPALSAETSSLLRQFNSAKGLDNPVDRYVGLFKVLEKAFASKRGVSLLKDLQASDSFFALGAEVLHRSSDPEAPLERRDFDDLLAKLVRIRDNCAHLRGKTGYAPGDPAVSREVEPYADLLGALARRHLERLLGGPDDASDMSPDSA